MAFRLAGACRRRRRLHSRFQQSATFVDVKVQWVRDRGLDHAVEREKHLLPLHSLKDFLLSHDASSSCGVPLSSISEHRHLFSLPFRPISFVRRYPSAFIEDPSPSAVPIIRPTPDLVRLHDEEISLHDSSRDDAAQRLLRLLMLTRRRNIPIPVLDRLRWDLGLPRDYARSVLPHYPHYFHPTPSLLDLVFWDRNLAVSAFRMRNGASSSSFPLQLSDKYGIDKKIKKWMDDWQEIPYMSPYDNDGTQLDPKSAIGEKWAVGVLHELLHLLISKKTSRDDLLLVGELAGLPSASYCKKLLLNYQGIFYVSIKNGTHTVLLREAYKRGTLVEKHPLMEMRSKYIHLMRNSGEDDAEVSNGRKKRKKALANENTLNDNHVHNDDGSDESDDECGSEDEDEEEEGEIPGSFESGPEESDGMARTHRISNTEKMPTGATTRRITRTTRGRRAEKIPYNKLNSRPLKTEKPFHDSSKKWQKGTDDSKSRARSEEGCLYTKAGRKPMLNART